MKKRLNKSLHFLIHIDGYKKILLYIITSIMFCIGLFSAMFKLVPSILIIFINIIAGGLLVLTIYHIIKDIKYINNSVIKPKLYKNQFTNKVVSDYRFRTFAFTVPGLTSNILFAIVNGIMGIYIGSAWFIRLSVYYILISMMRIGAVKQERIIYDIVDIQEKRDREIKIYKRNSILFIFMAWVLAGLIVLLEFSTGGKEYHGIIIYVMAMYVFYRFISSSIQMARVKKENSPLLTIVRKIGYVDASVSVLTLQTAMITEFSNNDIIYARYMNGITGFVVFILVLSFGVYGIWESSKMNKENNQI